MRDNRLRYVGGFALLAALVLAERMAAIWC